MAASYPGSYPDKVTPLTPRKSDSAAGPAIRKIGFSDLADALHKGWDDFKAVPSHALVLCIIYPILGLALARMTLGYSVLPLLFPLAAGFAILGPFAAIGLYELSRRRENGEQPTVSQAISVLKSPSFGAMLGLGAMLMTLFVVWIASAQAIYTATFGYAPAASIPDFAQHILTLPEGRALMLVGCGVASDHRPSHQLASKAVLLLIKKRKRIKIVPMIPPVLALMYLRNIFPRTEPVFFDSCNSFCSSF